MTRLIDADELAEIINWTFAKPPFSRKTVQKMIDMARTIDAVQVIRCKDCIYFTPEKSGEHWNVCRFYDAPKTADGYCNDAERKEE